MFHICQGSCFCAGPKTEEGFQKGKVLYCFGEVLRFSGSYFLSCFAPVPDRTLTTAPATSPGGNTEGRPAGGDGGGGREGGDWRAASSSPSSVCSNKCPPDFHVRILGFQC